MFDLHVSSMYLRLYEYTSSHADSHKMNVFYGCMQQVWRYVWIHYIDIQGQSENLGTRASIVFSRAARKRSPKSMIPRAYSGWGKLYVRVGQGRRSICSCEQPGVALRSWRHRPITTSPTLSNYILIRQLSCILNFNVNIIPAELSFKNSVPFGPWYRYELFKQIFLATRYNYIGHKIRIQEHNKIAIQNSFLLNTLSYD